MDIGILYKKVRRKILAEACQLALAFTGSRSSSVATSKFFSPISLTAISSSLVTISTHLQRAVSLTSFFLVVIGTQFTYSMLYGGYIAFFGRVGGGVGHLHFGNQNIQTNLGTVNPKLPDSLLPV